MTLFQGPLFNADVRNPQGRVFSWIDRMLSVRQQQQAASRLAAWGPSKAAVARTALRSVLQVRHEWHLFFTIGSVSFLTALIQMPHCKIDIPV